MRVTTRRWLAAFAIATSVPAAMAQDIAIGAAALRFAGIEEARTALGKDDEWTATTGDFQRKAVLGASADVPVQQFREALGRAARECTPEQKSRWQRAANQIAPRLVSLRLMLPASVAIVCTDGSDSANAPYTRGSAIFMPPKPEAGPYSDAEVLAHELFHVLTRHNPALATRIYAALGFQPTEALAWPDEWSTTRLSNPDAPHHRHYMLIETPRGPVALMPVLVARRTSLEPGETFFSVLDVRLLEVLPGAPGRATEPVRREGRLAWLPAGTPQYLSRLGGNTAYVFHPEETAADNFAFLVSGRQVRNPQLLDQIEKILVAPASP